MTEQDNEIQDGFGSKLSSELDSRVESSLGSQLGLKSASEADPIFFAESEKAAGKWRVRCPSCSKLYEVSQADLHSQAPQFRCLICQCRFTFNADMEILEDSALKNPVVPTVDAESQMKDCPKCGFSNPQTEAECRRCHVLFSRLEGLPQDPSVRAQPSLVRKWKSLLNDFEDTAKHDEFINSCRQLGALPFAQSKYQELKKIQGGDAICEQRLAQVQAYMLIDLEAQSQVSWLEQQSQHPRVQAALQFLSKFNWPKIAMWTPYLVSFALIVWGMVHLGHRNLIGLGVAIACLATGLILIIRGRLSLRDFFE